VPAVNNQFVDWDDLENFTTNTNYRGLGWTQLRWMWTTFLLGHYVPLTWMTLGLDYLVWGVNPAGYHLTNVLLHAVNAALFYLVAVRLLGVRGAMAGNERLPSSLSAAFAALVFAVHPLRVESVAWVTERRDVLSGVWFVATLLLYLGAVDASGPRRRWLLWASVGAYVLALAAKSTVMTLPFVLILLDVYPLRRLSGAPRTWFRPALRPVWLEKLPYLLLAVAGATMAHYAHVHAGSSPDTPWSSRIIVIFHSLWFYVAKTLVPIRLSPRYEAPLPFDLLEPRFLVAIIGVVSLSGLVLLMRARWPVGLALWVYYGLVLAPVSGITPLATILTADRYSYLVCLGWSLAVGLACSTVLETARRGTLRRPLAGLAGGLILAWLAALGTLTWRQSHVWHDSEHLWKHAVAATPECTVCRVNLGNWFQQHGQLEAARKEFETVLALRPDRVAIHANLAWTLTRLGLFTEAAEHYRVVLAHQPEALPVRSNLAIALQAAGQPGEAAHVLYGALEIGRPEAVAAFFREAASARPGEAVLRLGLVQAYLALGRPDLARPEYEILATLDPGLAEVGAGTLKSAGIRSARP
jgi:hypothetical protein